MSATLEGEFLTTGPPGDGCILFKILFQYELLQEMECSSVCYSVDPWWFPVNAHRCLAEQHRDRRTGSHWVVGEESRLACISALSLHLYQ